MLFIVLLVTSAASIAAQEATPSAGFDVPDPTDCTVEPRTEEELRALIQDAAATPVAAASPVANSTPVGPPPGEPADETAAAVNASWREFIACINAGDFPRIFALTSDVKLRTDFVQDLAGGATEESLIAVYMAEPAPLEPDHRAPFIPLTDMRVLPDGRVAAVGPGETGQGEVLIFGEDDGHWVVDDQFDLSPSA